jgi:DNA-directed RNA polymerase subunit F
MKILERARRVLGNAEALEIVKRMGKTKHTSIETMRYKIEEYVGGRCRVGFREKQELRNMGLTEFEVAQLTNICPKSPLDIHVAIEEMEERIEEGEVKRILEIFGK